MRCVQLIGMALTVLSAFSACREVQPIIKVDEVDTYTPEQVERPDELERVRLLLSLGSYQEVQLLLYRLSLNPDAAMRTEVDVLKAEIALTRGETYKAQFWLKSALDHAAGLERLKIGY